MAIWKRGDEAVCIWDRRKRGETWGVYLRSLLILRPGKTYTVVGLHQYPEGLGLSLSEVDNPTTTSLWNSRYFRKAVKRNDSLSIEAFLTIKPGQFEEPRKAPAKKRERA